MTTWTQVRKDVMVTTVGTKKRMKDDLVKKLELIPNPCGKLSRENCIDSKKVYQNIQ